MPISQSKVRRQYDFAAFRIAADALLQRQAGAALGGMLTILSLGCSHALAQKADGPGIATVQTQETQSGSYVLHQSVEEVLLYCTVLDGRGHMVSDLKKQNFTVRDSKVRVPLTSFRYQDDPVSLGLIIDASASMRSKRDSVNAAALALVRASNPKDETFILNFSEQSYLDQDFTGDLEKLRGGLDKSNVAGGGTALYDTLISAVDHLSRGAKHSKQAVVVITDGKDNASTATLEQAIQRVQQTNGPVVYTIGLLYDSGGRDTRQARHALEALAEKTGGISFFPRSLDEVAPIADEVAHDIRSQYRISFRPPLSFSANTYHPITVEASTPGRGKLRVRTRKGYLRTPTNPQQ